jgi:uncharacterized protein YkwD
MNKYLPTVLALIITLSFAAQPVSASFSSQNYQSTSIPKKYYDLWQQIVLRNILQQQAAIIPSKAPVNTPIPSLKVTTTPANTTATPTIKPTIKPTAKPTTPTPTKIPTTPPVSSSTTPTNDVTAYIMKEINAYRSSLGLSAIQTNDETCSFAKIRAQEIATSFTHDGFNNRKIAGTLPYASWTAITENIAMTSNYKDVEKMWENSAGHAANMRANTPYVCVIQYNNYFAYEGMKP